VRGGSRGTRQSIEAHLLDTPFDDRRVGTWVNAICEDVVAGLAELAKPFKFVVSCVIMQNIGAGMHSAHASYCDGINDGVVTVKWPTDKNKDQTALYCVVTVFGAALFSR
jgi:dynein light chain Tctex-type 1